MGKNTDLVEKLKKLKKKTISKTELEKLCCTATDEALYEILQDNSDVLIPIIGSKTNGNRRFPIYLKYRISLGGECNEAVITALNQLHPKLLKKGWLKAHPNEYRNNKNIFDRLSEFLFQGNKAEYCSRKERSFDIFDEEKLLDGSDIKKLLNHLEITNADLQMYDTPEYCFNDFIPDRCKKMTLLVCENKDIWFNIRRLMYEDVKMVYFDMKIDGVVYGAGNKVTGQDFLTQYAGFMSAEVSFLYWGDIDRAGLDIFLRAKRANPSLHIDLFLPGYKKMLELADGRNIPDSEDGRDIKTDFEEIYKLLGTKNAHDLSFYIENNKRLPQEIVSYEVLKNNSKE